MRPTSSSRSPVVPVALLSLALAACGDDGASAAGGGGAGGALTGAGGSQSSSGAGAGPSSSGSGSGGAAPSASSAGAGGEAGAGGAAAFELEVETALDGPALVLSTNLPEDAAGCAGIPGAPCDDADGDGLVDAWEDVVLDRLRPLVVFDEDESLFAEPNFALGLVGRVAPTPAGVLVTMMLGYAEDFGSCGGFTAHPGDSERVALLLSADEGDARGDARVVAAYTAAHEGTVSDHGQVFRDADLGQLVHTPDPSTTEPRWTVFSSADKHATYGSIEICEGVSVIPCFDEDCGPDGVDPADFSRLFDFVNAGEQDAPRTSDLSVLGFVGDDAWADREFCGGQGGDGCSAPVRDKLLDDPFD